MAAEPEPRSVEVYRPRVRKAKEPDLLLGTFLEQYITIQVSRHVKPKYTEQMMRRYFGLFFHRPMSGITREELVRWHAAIGAKYPIAANKALTQLKAVYNKAIEWGLYKGENPCRYVKKFPEVGRSRFVQPGEEMARLTEALEKDELKHRAFFTLLLLTGARRSEASRMKWPDINLGTGLWTKWTTKTHRAHTIHVPEPALVLIRQLPRLSEYVFTTSTGKRWRESTIHYVWQRIRARAGLDDVSIHDLRRTCASWMAMNGENMAVIQQVLNHASLMHTSIYARLNTQPVQQALSANAERILNQGEKP